MLTKFSYSINVFLLLLLLASNIELLQLLKQPIRVDQWISITFCPRVSAFNLGKRSAPNAKFKKIQEN
jgi:hypothetical protein